MKLYLINLGSCDADKGAVLTPGSGDGQRINIPIVAYLIETDDGQRILVDSGMHPRHIDDPQATFGGTPFADSLTPIMRAEDTIANRLAEVGLAVDDIEILVSTHFHFDHAGNHGTFGGARIVAQRAAYDFAMTHPEACPHDIWNLPHLRYELIAGELDLAPGVELIETPGHVPGHLSVLVRLPRAGAMLLAIDAIYTQENLQTNNWQGQNDPESGRESGRKLVEIAAREHATIIYGHDPAQWAGLKRAPEFYD